MAQKRLIHFEDTRFIFATNFSGDPARDNYRNDERKGNIVIPSYEQAQALIDEGFNVRETTPREGEEEGFEPTYFIAAKLNYDSQWPPKVYLVAGDAEPRLLDEDSVGEIDVNHVVNVNVTCNPYNNARTGRKSLYIKTMYVEIDVEDDPFAARYRRD